MDVKLSKLVDFRVMYINLLKPSGFTDFRTGSDFCFIRHESIVFITVVKSVYSAVRTDSLHKVDYISSLKG
jgi:hypothetical protein